MKFSKLFSFGFVFVLFSIVFFDLTGCSGRDKSLAFYNQGLEKYRARDFANAAFFFSRSEKADGRFLPAVLMRGKCFFFQRRFSEARDSFESALKKDPSSGTAAIWIGRLDLMENKPTRESSKRLKQLVERDDENVGVYILLAQMAEREGKLAEAADDYELALSFEKETSIARTRLVEIYQKLGLPDRAVKGSKMGRGM